MTIEGRNRSNFTATRQLFVDNSVIEFWRFEVIYTFTLETSSNIFNVAINKAPANGSCSIEPSNGTTSTTFTIACVDWFDVNEIKDYTVFGKDSILVRLAVKRILRRQT
jgi:hypothetical protein